MQVEHTVQLLLLRHKEQIMVSINDRIFTMKTCSVSPWRTYRQMLQAFLLNKRSKAITKFRLENSIRFFICVSLDF